MNYDKVAYIGLGSNLEPRRENIDAAVEAMGIDQRIYLCRLSDVIETKPLAGRDGPDYLNCVAEIETSLSPQELLEVLQSIEKFLGRDELQHNHNSRTIDLDILLFGSETINTDRLTIPHSQMHLRSFVLKGLSQLCPDIKHPVLNRTMRQLYDRLNGGDYNTDKSSGTVISVAGCIGAGKTTLADGLSELYGYQLLKEDYRDNPFLADVYAGKTELALDSQLYFLLSRGGQLAAENFGPDTIAVSDYIMDKELIYAELWLDSFQFAMYEKINSAICQRAVEPNLVVYLKLAPAKCLQRIKMRKRPYEQRIELKFLENICSRYEKLFKSFDRCPVITVDAEEFDFRDAWQVETLGKEINYYINFNQSPDRKGGGVKCKQQKR